MLVCRIPNATSYNTSLEFYTVRCKFAIELSEPEKSVYPFVSTEMDFVVTFHVLFEITSVKKSVLMKAMHIVYVGRS